MKPIIIFGTGKIAEVVHYYMTQEGNYEVVAFAVDKNYLTETQFLDLPVIVFEEIETHFPPEKFDMFVAMGYHNLNEVRAKKVAEATEKGFNLVSFVHPKANVPNDTVIGKNCLILNQALIQPRVVLGDNVFVWGNATVGHHSEIGNHVWITSTANIAGCVKIGERCFLAMNATLGDNVSIGNDCFIGANALVTKSIPDGYVMIEESTKPFRLNSKQFMRIFKSFY